MKVVQGDRVFIRTGPAAGEFGEIGWYDRDSRLFAISLDGDTELQYIAPKQFDVINIDMDYLMLFEGDE